MRLFHYEQKRAERISPELQQLIRRRLHLVDRTFQYAKANRETFLSILSKKGETGAVLRSMHQVDFLGRYIPEFGELTCLVQHEFFHRYTADEHTLVCIEKLDALLSTDDPKLQGYRKLWHQLEDPAVLYLAILLHDTGKAANVRHHAEASALSAQRVAVRLQLAPSQRRMLIFLVDHHSTLSNTAQRRNLEDPATIEEFAGLVCSQTNLDALMLLTLVDGQGVGDDDGWSDWKESLVWQTYRSAKLYLADNVEFFRQRRVERLGEPRYLCLQMRGPHVGGRCIHQVADERDRFGEAKCFVDPRRVARQQDARARALVVAQIAVEPVVGEQPAQRGGAGRPGGEAVASFGEGLRQLCKTPGGQVIRIGNHGH
jgi:[protein-PII] uridylyltransferase